MPMADSSEVFMPKTALRTKENSYDFIRAPYISRVGDGVEVLAQVDGKTVAARQGKQLVTAFHPELNNDLTVHNYFIKMINGEI